MIDPELLKILACPESLQPLAEADAALLARINQRIERGELKNVGGDVIRDKFEAGLVRQDGLRVYPIRDGISVLLVNEGVDLAASGSAAKA